MKWAQDSFTFTAGGTSTKLSFTSTTSGGYGPALDNVSLQETLPAETLTVTLAGTGSGNVTSTPAGINCPTSCTKSYPNGTPVTLTATAASGSTFAGWSGDCTGTGTCVVTMNAAKSVTATFNTNPITPPPSTPKNKSDCKDGGWMNFTNPSFKNQGQCVAFTNHQ